MIDVETIKRAVIYVAAGVAVLAIFRLLDRVVQAIKRALKAIIEYL